MNIAPYLPFNGNCEEACAFYGKALGAKIEALFRFEGSPAAEHVPEEWRNKVMHCCLSIGGQQIMASDGMPDSHREPQGITVSLQVDTPEEAETLYAALTDGGTEVMPMNETFWALRFGMVTDRFGIPWMVNCSRPDFGD